jgi:hypothetical protein
MARKPPAEIKVDTFADHQVISQPNPLRKMVRYSDEKDIDDPVARDVFFSACSSDVF